ncbi:Clp protease N-terminal domain-containing protein [Actinomadura kijaniata]|uniref:ATP-dependent Clp protease ATP-binding subunit ClpA n=1 Tax=Actinomadura namibiensis TaxID=182080 RepID=A0A7W3QSC7_ACTNM|nr:Clp protease N-terminal domain-containing protein [Actinomadura namibiensis]MBA8957268.1 ATP-dependent Clp protease ATP-binding subunit ClpA [Actinomadura namibiensis]
MFERFSRHARLAVVTAQEVARELGDGEIGTEHVLLGLLEADGSAAATLRAHGLDPGGLRARLDHARRPEGPLDAEALRLIGIDLEAVRAAAEWSFGEGALDAPAGRFRKSRKGHIPFTKQAKKSLELALRHAIRLKQNHISSGHVLLGVLHDPEFTSVRVLRAAGADVDALRADVTRRIAEAA